MFTLIILICGIRWAEAVLLVSAIKTGSPLNHIITAYFMKNKIKLHSIICIMIADIKLENSANFITNSVTAGNIVIQYIFTKNIQIFFLNVLNCIISYWNISCASLSKPINFPPKNTFPAKRVIISSYLLYKHTAVMPQ
uniref:Putative secreted protein n=1 Tax=Panstrongylus lignarius TaxID=156445 RepID=A0A224XZM2_9HEMI